MKCPICKKDTYKFYEGWLGYEAMRCSNCGFESSAETPELFKKDVLNFNLKSKKYTTGELFGGAIPSEIKDIFKEKIKKKLKK